MNDKEFEVGYDDSNCWGVFGVDSGHCYSLYSDKGEAERNALERQINQLQSYTFDYKVRQALVGYGSGEVLRVVYNNWVDALKSTGGDSDPSVLKRHIRFVKKLSEAIEIVNG